MLVFSKFALDKSLILFLTLFSIGNTIAQDRKQVKNEITIDADFAGGNIVLHEISKDTVFLYQDLKDTEGNWFYWSFRVKGAENRKLYFKFIHPWNDIPRMPVIAANGPAASVDGGQTWKWLGRENNSDNSFSYLFPKGSKEVYFSMGMPYTSTHLQTFLEKYKSSAYLEESVLTQTKQGRKVEKLHIGNLRSKPQYRVIITARHHACEMMGSYVVEGIIQELLSANPEAKWLVNNVEFLVIPFVDKDGVENGDQGKNRRGRDHNRDYSGQNIYNSTRALQAFVPVWSSDVPLIGLDLHCPFIAGGDVNEQIYLVGGRDLLLANAESQFSTFLEQQTEKSKGLQYLKKNNIPFGTSWNTVSNYTKGASFREWIGTIPTIKLASTIEVPYANASGREVNQESSREFGQKITRAIYDFLNQK